MRIGPLGVWEILIILVVILLIFGPRRLPEMAKGIGQSVREFRKGIRDIREDITKDDDEPKRSTVTVTSDAAPPSQAQPSQSSAAPTTHVAPAQTQPVQPQPVHTVQPDAEEGERTEVKSA